jgi:hypothetical protein
MKLQRRVNRVLACIKVVPREPNLMEASEVRRRLDMVTRHAERRDEPTLGK